MQDVSTTFPTNVGRQVEPISPGIGPPPSIPDASDPLRGLKELLVHCSTVYPTVNEPICFRSNKSLILGDGNDPLNYIYIYKNDANPKLEIPAHWHYVSFGLSDIYNYGRLCEIDRAFRETNECYNKNTPPLPEFYPKPVPNMPRISGFGFELTFRLKCDSLDGSEQPPMWPGQVMQELARYVFRVKTPCNVNDHVDWDRPLDDEGSRIENMLMTLDPKLQEVETTLGSVKFIQIVGVCREELQAAREFNVRGVLDIMSKRIETGGELLITDMRRGQTIFELDPENRLKIDEGISAHGSDMILICALHTYSAKKPKWFKEVEQSMHHRQQNNGEYSNEGEYDCLMRNLGETLQQHTIPGVERGNLLTMPRDDSKAQDNNYNGSRVPSRMSLESESDLVIGEDGGGSELLKVRAYDNLYLLLRQEAAKVLPVALKGRLAHGKPFTYQNFNGQLLTTFVPEGTTVPSLVSEEQPFARRGTWLQIYVSRGLQDQMIKTFEETPIRDYTTDLNLSWPDYNFHITIVDEIREPMDMNMDID